MTAITTTQDKTTADRSRWIALVVLCVGMLMIVLDATIVNVALPSIQDDLGFSQSNLAWIVNAYMIAFGGLLLLSGRIGDLIGQRRVFLTGLAVFTAASVVCAVAPSQGVLIGARVLQGLAAAALTPQVLSIIQVTFPPQERARAFGLFGAVVGFASAAGQGLGGLLVQADLLGLSWRIAFLINLPVGVAVLLGAVSILVLLIAFIYVRGFGTAIPGRERGAN